MDDHYELWIKDLVCILKWLVGVCMRVCKRWRREWWWGEERMKEGDQL